MLRDALGIVADLGSLRVFPPGHEAGLLEERQIDVAFDIAGRSGIAVPVPRAAELAAFLDDADVVYARIAQPGAGKQAAEPAADHHDLLVVGERRAVDGRIDIRVVEIVRELTLHLDILLVGVGAQTLVTLLPIPGA